jgi:heat shock protein HslJ
MHASFTLGEDMLRNRQRLRILILLALAAVLAACGVPAEQSDLLGEDKDVTPTTNAVDLASTEWILTSLNGQNLLEGSNITLAFNQGTAGGFAGCNSYSGKYAMAEDGSLSIYEIASTAMACSEPQGIMEQEQTYLETLQNAATYRMIDDQVEIVNAADETMLVFIKREQFATDPDDRVLSGNVSP